MAFQAGNPGRPFGAISKRSQAVDEKAKELGIDPFEILLRFAAGDWEGLGYDSREKEIKVNGGGSYFVDTITAEARIQAAKEACQYLFPKRKSIEHVTNNSLANMSPTQKLEALRHAVKLLEGECEREARDTSG